MVTNPVFILNYAVLLTTRVSKNKIQKGIIFHVLIKKLNKNLVRELVRERRSFLMTNEWL